MASVIERANNLRNIITELGKHIQEFSNQIEKDMERFDKGSVEFLESIVGDAQPKAPRKPRKVPDVSTASIDMTLGDVKQAMQNALMAHGGMTFRQLSAALNVDEDLLKKVATGVNFETYGKGGCRVRYSTTPPEVQEAPQQAPSGD